MFGTRVISWGERSTSGSKGPLQVNLLVRKNPKNARVKAAHSVTWSRLELSSGLRRL